MATTISAKSILKQKPQQPTPATKKDVQNAQTARNARHMDIALQHAYKIQQQKDIQAQILRNIETLMHFPTSSSGPTAVEAQNFTTLISFFQPSNFDEVVEERCADGRCGYVLCGNEPRSSSLGASASWKLAKGAGNWCSNLCAKKALYVRAQLSETPAWERVPGQQAPIVLHEDDWRLLGRTIGQGVGNSSDVASRVANAQDLAQERGETASSLRPGRVMTEAVVEKVPSAPVAERATKVTFASAIAIEGYEPKGISFAEGKEADQARKTDAAADNESDNDAADYDDLLRSGSPLMDSEEGTNYRTHSAEDEESWKEMFQALKTRDASSAT